jgi:hypothetical protein
MRRAFTLTAVVCALIFSATASFAHSGELLNFHGWQDMQAVGNFYLTRSAGALQSMVTVQESLGPRRRR